MGGAGGWFEEEGVGGSVVGVGVVWVEGLLDLVGEVGGGGGGGGGGGEEGEGGVGGWGGGREGEVSERCWGSQVRSAVGQKQE